MQITIKFYMGPGVMCIDQCFVSVYMMLLITSAALFLHS